METAVFCCFSSSREFSKFAKEPSVRSAAVRRIGSVGVRAGVDGGAGGGQVLSSPAPAVDYKNQFRPDLHTRKKLDFSITSL
jgi:hypothetical protein